ncbi:MAG: GDSL-type esterase/lipase family protein [Ilumatobacteraceae bacterium]
MNTSIRRRHSSRRYAFRRAVALVVVLVLGYGLVRVVAAVVGGDDGVADADGDVATVAAGPDDASADGEDGTVGAADAASTVPDEPETTGPPSVDNPSKVFIVGDSDAGTFGPYLQTLLDNTGIVTTELDYKVSSGLSRPDFFDWPAEIDAKLPEVDPDIVVATFGGNDAQGLAVQNGEFIIGDPVANEAEWVAEYSERAGAVMDQLLADGRTLIWVGIPNDDNPEVTARMAIQDRAARAAAAERPEVIFIDTWQRFSGRDGGWAEFVIDPRDGQGKDVRADDGFHLNQTGAEILAIDIAQAIRDTLREQGAQI